MKTQIPENLRCEDAPKPHNPSCLAAVFKSVQRAFPKDRFYLREAEGRLPYTFWCREHKDEITVWVERAGNPHHQAPPPPPSPAPDLSTMTPSQLLAELARLRRQE